MQEQRRAIVPFKEYRGVDLGRLVRGVRIDRIDIEQVTMTVMMMPKLQHIITVFEKTRTNDLP